MFAITNRCAEHSSINRLLFDAGWNCDGCMLKICDLTSSPSQSNRPCRNHTLQNDSQSLPAAARTACASAVGTTAPRGSCGRPLPAGGTVQAWARRWSGALSVAAQHAVCNAVLSAPGPCQCSRGLRRPCRGGRPRACRVVRASRLLR